MLARLPQVVSDTLFKMKQGNVTGGDAYDTVLQKQVKGENVTSRLVEHEDTVYSALVTKTFFERLLKSYEL